MIYLRVDFDLLVFNAVSVRGDCARGCSNEGGERGRGFCHLGGAWEEWANIVSDECDVFRCIGDGLRDLEGLVAENAFAQDAMGFVLDAIIHGDGDVRIGREENARNKSTN